MLSKDRSPPALGEEPSGRREFHYNSVVRIVVGGCVIPLFGFSLFFLFAGVSPLLGICAAFWGPPLPHPILSEVMSFAVGLLSAIGGVYFIRVFFGFADYAVVVDPEGIAYLRREDAKLAWSGIAALRFRPLLGRLDLLDAKGAEALSIDYHVDQFNELLNIIVARILPNLEPVSLPRKLAAKRSLGDVIVGACVLLLLVCAILAGDQFLGYLIVASILAGVHLYSRFFQLRSLLVTTDSITVVKGFNRRTISWSQVSAATLRVRGNVEDGDPLKGYPNVRLILADGSYVDVQPVACDPFDVLRTIRTAMSAAGR